jgi:VanZ family protein
MRLYSIKTTLARTALTGYLLILTYLSLRPVSGDGRGAAVAWILHIIAYLGLGVLVAISFPQRFEQRRIRSIVEVALFGLAIEVIQLVMPTRTFSIIDIAMNGIGAGISWFTPVIRSRLVSEDDEGGPGAGEDEEITAGDLEGRTPRPDDMRMIGDRPQDQQS